jgi:hypothetical protein
MMGACLAVRQPKLPVAFYPFHAVQLFCFCDFSTHNLRWLLGVAARDFAVAKHVVVAGKLFVLWLVGLAISLFDGV